MTFEKAMSRLDEIVKALEKEGAPLDESLKLFGEGAELIAYCNKALETAQLKIEELFPEEEHLTNGKADGSDKTAAR